MKTTKEPKPGSQLSTLNSQPSDPLPEGVDQLIDASLIDPHPSNRKIFPEDSLVEMEASVREHGILQRPTIRPVPGTGRYQLVFGERRWRGATRVDPHYSLPVTVRPLSDRQTLELQKIENLQREDLDPIEEAIGLRQMVEEFGYTLEQLEARLGRKKSAIYGKLKLANLCDLAVAFYRKGAFSESVAIRIARLPTAELQHSLLVQCELLDGRGRRDEQESLAAWTADKYDQVSDRGAAEIISQHFMKELKRAPFDQKSDSLLPIQLDDHGQRIAGGACTDCPLRSGNLPDFDPKRGRADVCLNPACYRMKAELGFAQKSAVHVEAGGQALPSNAEQLGAIFGSYGDDVAYSSPYQAGDQQCFELKTKDKEGPSLAELAKAVGVKPLLALHPRTSEVLKLYNRREVEAAALAQDIAKPRFRSSGASADQKAAMERARQDAFVDRTLMTGLVDYVAEEGKPTLSLLRFLAQDLADGAHADTARNIVKRRSIDIEPYKGKSNGIPHRPALADLAASELTMAETLGLLVELVVTPAYGRPQLSKAYEKLGLDYKGLEKEARDSYREQKKEKQRGKQKGKGGK